MKTEQYLHVQIANTPIPFAISINQHLPVVHEPMNQIIESLKE
jgi:hypothetical protein